MIDLSLRDNPGLAATSVRVILPVLMLAVFTISLGFGILLPQLPALVERLLGVGSTPAQTARATGLLTAICMLTLFICAPVWDWLSDTWGRRPMLLFGLTGFSATMITSVYFERLATVYIRGVRRGWSVGSWPRPARKAGSGPDAGADCYNVHNL